MNDKAKPTKTIDKGKMSMDINLRSIAMGIHFDSKNLHLVGVRNNINQLLYKGWETLPHFESRTDEEIVDFIEEFQGKNGVKRADAYLLMPRSEVITQIVEFPPEAANNLEEVMEYQLVNYFALDQEEYEFFPQILGRGDQLKVMIVAIKKAFLGHTFGFIRRWDLKLAGLSLDTFGLINGIARLEPERFAHGQTIIFRAFPEGLEMIGLRENKLVLSHYMSLSRDLDGEMPGEFNPDVLVAGVEEGFSQARMEPNEVDNYLWVGDYQEDVRAFLSEESGIPFGTWVDGAGEVIDEGALAGFGGAVCAVHDNVALDLNMLPEKQRKRHKRLPVVLAAVVLVIAMLFFVFNEAKDFMSLREEHALLKANHARFQTEMAKVADARADLEAKQAELVLYKKFQTNKMLLKMIDSMAQDLPDDTYLTSLIIKKGEEVTIQGESDQPFDVQRILTRMPFLTDVKSSNAITAGRNKDGRKRFMYKANIVLEALR